MDAVRALRLSRQRLLDPIADADEYRALFALMSPVQPPYWCYPGSPPSLAFRASFDDAALCFDMRARREIAKGRFQGGNVAYVFAGELDLYGAAYRRDVGALSQAEREMLSLLEREGPMNIGLIREFTGMPAKHITPLLHELQREFLVFEDQFDDEWDRAWYPFAAEFPDVDLNGYSRAEAIEALILRFAYLNARIDRDMLRSFYRFTLRDIDRALTALERKSEIAPYGSGYALASDIEALRQGARDIPPHAFALHRNDFLVKSNEHWLKEKYKHAGHDILQYIWLDGEFIGAVLGRFRNGPFDIEDVCLSLPAQEAKARKAEIIAAIGRVNNPEKSPVKRYQGEDNDV